MPHQFLNVLGSLKSITDKVIEDRLLVGLLLTFGLLAVITPHGFIRAPYLVDWPTMAALTGLLTLTKLLDLSGALHWLADRVAFRMPNQRALALAIVVMAAVLSMVLTNDVALFVVVPVTLALTRAIGLSPTKLIVFEALAVNAGSALTPIGNPQNLYLWQTSKVSFGGFVMHMLPLVLILLALLLIVTAISFPKKAIAVEPVLPAKPIDRIACFIGLGLFLPFLYATNIGQAIPAVAVILAIVLFTRRRAISGLDWGLLATFILMFIDLRLLASLPMIVTGLEALKLEVPAHLYWTGIGASQIISNVPATIALVQYSPDWRSLAYGANIGGFGILIGSLANLIAMRLSGDKQYWIVFHVYAVPFLAVGAVVGYIILFCAP